MRVPLLDLKSQFKQIEKDIRAAVGKVLENQQFILGDAVESFEKAAAGYCQVPYAIGCASGSDALLLALMALGVGKGDEVITSPFSFYSSASCITRLGAKPVFADINPLTFNISPDAVAAAVGPRTRAILPIHLFGQIAEMDRIVAIAVKAGVAVVEDAAQAFGARFDNKPAGSIGDVGCFSFYPSKNLGAYGDAGLLTTGNKELAERLRCLRIHGEREKYVHHEIGINSRLDAIQAALLEAKLPYLDGWSDARRLNGGRYDRLLTERWLVPEFVQLPYNVESEDRRHRHIFNQYTLRVRDRDKLLERLRKEGIGCAVYYPVPLYLQPCFRFLGYEKGHCPEAEKASREVISLPIYPELTEEQQGIVANAIEEFYRS